ncbi:MAG: hypothetical protein R2765_06695 [Ferruginibacter sp.]
MKKIFYSIIFNGLIKYGILPNTGPKEGQDWNRNRDVYADNHHRASGRLWQLLFYSQGKGICRLHK